MTCRRKMLSAKLKVVLAFDPRQVIGVLPGVLRYLVRSVVARVFQLIVEAADQRATEQLRIQQTERVDVGVHDAQIGGDRLAEERRGVAEIRTDKPETKVVKQVGIEGVGLRQHRAPGLVRVRTRTETGRQIRQTRRGCQVVIAVAVAEERGILFADDPVAPDIEVIDRLGPVDE